MRMFLRLICVWITLRQLRSEMGRVVFYANMALAHFSIVYYGNKAVSLIEAILYNIYCLNIFFNMIGKMILNK